MRLAAASHLLLVMGLLLRDHRRSRPAIAMSLFVGCVVCYLALPALTAPAIPQAVRSVANVGALAIPFAFWVTTRLWFDDAFQLRPVQGVLLLAALATRILVLRWPVAASAIAAVAVLDALYRIHAGKQTDLLLSRLRLRYVILGGTGLYALLILAAEATVARGSPVALGLDAANDVGLYLLAVAVCVSIFRIEPDLVRVATRPATASEPTTVLAKRLERLIEEDQVFKTEGLTIGALAERLGEHEYKVRQLINMSLGFRNFGAFLNHYRVREACKVLADPAQRQLGIAEIAYRLGYASLGPFNRAFKEIVGETPTEYRKGALDQEMLADSEIGQASSKGS
jgi:AraC-like DNA-binding protein